MKKNILIFVGAFAVLLSLSSNSQAGGIFGSKKTVYAKPYVRTGHRSILSHLDFLNLRSLVKDHKH